jgi:integrase
MGLTNISIRNLKPGPVRREIRDANGLCVIVQPSGHKSFAVRYRYNGKAAKLTLGPGNMSLAAARKLCADAMYELAQGRDPAAAKRQARQTQTAARETFEAIAEEYLRREGGKLRSEKSRRSVLARLVYPIIGDRPVGEIKRSEIIRLLDRIEEDAGPVAADMALAIIRKILNWHATRSDDFRSPIVRGMARTNGQERARSRTLSDDELRAIWTATEDGGMFSSLVRFLLLTAARRTEAASLMWKEIDSADWTLPAARNKVKVDLVRPLSAAAQDVLAKLPQIAGCEFAFTANGGHALRDFSRGKQKLDAKSGVAGWTLHDLRRTARSLMSRAGVNSDHAERCLGHVIGGVRGTYDRHAYHDEKQRAFEALAGLIHAIVSPTSNVVPMRGLT